MTPQEAISTFKEWIERDKKIEYADRDENIEIYKTAIKALEQQPCEDTISRTALLSRIDAERKHLLDLKMDGAEHIIVHHARRIIEDMPSVIPNTETKKGEN